MATDGQALRREVMGDAHVDRMEAGTGAFGAPLQELITRHVWGEVWSRPGLDRRSRSIATLAALTTLRAEELAIHVRAALRNGLTPEEIAELLLHVSVYVGVPASVQAFAVAERVIAEVAAEGR